MAMHHYHAQTYVENGENNQGQHAVSQTYGYQDGQPQPTRTYTESTAVYHAPQSTTTTQVVRQQPVTTTTYQGGTTTTSNTTYTATNRNPGYTVSTTNYDNGRIVIYSKSEKDVGRSTYSQTQPTSTTVYTPGQAHTTTTYGAQPTSYQPRTSNQGLSHGALQGGVLEIGAKNCPFSDTYYLEARETVKLVENTPEYKVYQYRSVHKETLKIDDASRKVVHGDRFSDGTPVKRASYAGSEMSPEGHFNPRRSTPYSNSKYITVVRNGREIKEEIFDYN